MNVFCGGGTGLYPWQRSPVLGCLDQHTFLVHFFCGGGLLCSDYLDFRLLSLHEKVLFVLELIPMNSHT